MFENSCSLFVTLRLNQCDKVCENFSSLGKGTFHLTSSYIIFMEQIPLTHKVGIEKKFSRYTVNGTYNDELVAMNLQQNELLTHSAIEHWYCIANDVGINFKIHPRLGGSAIHPLQKSNSVHIVTLRHNYCTSIGSAFFNTIPKDVKTETDPIKFERSLDMFLQRIPNQLSAP